MDTSQQNTNTKPLPLDPVDCALGVFVLVFVLGTLFSGLNIFAGFVIALAVGLPLTFLTVAALSIRQWFV